MVFEDPGEMGDLFVSKTKSGLLDGVPFQSPLIAAFQAKLIQPFSECLANCGMDVALELPLGNAAKPRH